MRRKVDCEGEVRSIEREKRGQLSLLRNVGVVGGMCYLPVDKMHNATIRKRKC